MSPYTTKYITREQAEEKVRACRAKTPPDVSSIPDHELEEELNQYVYSGEYSDILPILDNYRIN